MSTEQDEGGRLAEIAARLPEAPVDRLDVVRALASESPTGEPPMITPAEAVALLDAPPPSPVGDAVPYSDAPVDFALYATETFPLGGADGPPMGVVTAVDREAGVVTVGSGPDVGSATIDADGTFRMTSPWIPAPDLPAAVEAWRNAAGAEWRIAAFTRAVQYERVARESTGLARWEAQAAAEALRKFAEET